MSSVVLSIGSNLGDRRGHLQSVVDALGERVDAVSPIYATAPWGGIEQQDFLNAVVLAHDDEAGPYDWLRLAGDLEQQAERTREKRWGPRTLDVDVVVCDDVRSLDPELILPHPRAHLRAFVLIPWWDVQPDATLSVEGRDIPIAELIARIDAEERAGVRRCDDSLEVSARSGDEAL